MEAVIKTALVGSCIALWGPSTIAPLDRAFIGYRQAGEWLTTLAGPGEGLIDLKGFSLYYAEKSGYTFATIDEGRQDPKVRWIVTHDAHVNGPWDYSKSCGVSSESDGRSEPFPRKPSRGIAESMCSTSRNPKMRPPISSTPSRPSFRAKE